MTPKFQPPKSKTSLRVVCLVTGLIVGISAIALTLVSFGSIATTESLTVKGQPNEAETGGFTARADNPDTKGWSEQNKSLVLNFSLEHKDRRFSELTTAEVSVSLNDQPVALTSDGLFKRPDNEPSKVLFMFDVSGSMRNTKNSYGANKLQAAKDSFHFFVSNLDPNDEAAIGVFNTEYHPTQPLTREKPLLHKAIDDLKAAGNTKLYESLDQALKQAKTDGIQIIVLLSDGMDDPDDTRNGDPRTVVSAGKLPTRTSEESIAQQARDSGIRIFAIAIGKQGDSRNYKGVDFEPLKRISERTSGKPSLIDLPKLYDEAGGSVNRLNERLTEELTKTLTEIKKLFRFGYGLRVKLPELQEGNGNIRLRATADRGDQRFLLTIDYSYAWRRDLGAPKFLPGTVTWQFINVVPRVDRFGLTRIFLALLVPLVLLGLLPSATRRIAATHELRRIRRAIEIIERNSPWQGKQCPNEIGPGSYRYVFQLGDTLLICPKCGTGHHLRCWRYNQHQCMNRTCRYEFTIPPRLLTKHGIDMTESGLA